jgi:hypothetical protein
LESFVKGYIEDTTQRLSAQPGAEFLQNFIEVFTLLSTTTGLFSDVSMYYDRETTTVPYLQLFMTSWTTDLTLRFQKSVRFTVWMLLKTQPQAKVLEHPLVRDIAISICNSIPISSTHLRPVFLATRQLHSHISRPRKLAQIRHWGLVVGETRQNQTLYEVEKPRSGIAIPQRKSFATIEFRGEDTHGWTLTRNPIGYTSLSDNAIAHHSKRPYATTMFGRTS